MIFLYILGGILLLLLLVLFLRLGVRISYYGGAPALGVKIGCARYLSSRGHGATVDIVCFHAVGNCQIGIAAYGVTVTAAVDRVCS